MFSITLKAGQWRAIIESVSNLTSSDKARRPILTAVCIKCDEDGARFTATDSYIVGTISAAANGDGATVTGAGSVLLEPKRLGDCVKFVTDYYGTTAKTTGIPVTLEFDGITASVFLKGSNADPIRAEIVEGTYPNTDTLLNMGEGTNSRVSFSPVVLGRLTSALTAFHGGKKSAITASACFTFFDNGRPCTVTARNGSLGLEFIGGIMPVRVS